MKAISFEGKDTVAVVDKPIPQVTEDTVLIKVAYAGICGSDLSIVAGKHPRAKAPLVMGHEFSGAIVELPPNSRPDLKVGDRVTVFPLITCGKCYICQVGLPHVCKELKLFGIDADGAFAEYVRVMQDTVFKIPDSLSYQEGALIEPLAVCIHSARMSRLQIGDTVVVTGAGPIGLLMALVARAAGAAQVIVTELSPVRIAGAEKLGFTVLNAADDNLVEQVLGLTQGRGGDIVFEATGHPSVAPYLLDLVRIRGQIVQVGIFKEPTAIDLRAVNFHEVDLIGARVYTREDYDQTISLAAQQRFDLKSIAVEVRPLDEAVAAFASAKAATAVKTMFKIMG